MKLSAVTKMLLTDHIHMYKRFKLLMQIHRIVNNSISTIRLKSASGWANSVRMNLSVCLFDESYASMVEIQYHSICPNPLTKLCKHHIFSRLCVFKNAGLKLFDKEPIII